MVLCIFSSLTCYAEEEVIVLLTKDNCETLPLKLLRNEKNVGGNFRSSSTVHWVVENQYEMKVGQPNRS